MTNFFETVHRELIYLWFFLDILVRQIGPYWLVGIIAGSCVSVFCKDKIAVLLTRLNATRNGTVGIVPAALLGIVSPLCMYGTIPIAASLSKSNMRQDWLASFMMSSILLNPQLFVFSFALGTPLALLRLGVSCVGGILAGLLVHLFYDESHGTVASSKSVVTQFFCFEQFDVPHNHDRDVNIVMRFAKNIGRNIRITFPYFALGLVLTSLYQIHVPQEAVAVLFGKKSEFATLIAAGFGVPLYTCGGGTIPLISAWLDSGMSYGSAVAFMISGPGTKLTNLGALKMALGAKHFFIYVGYVIVFAAVSGLLVNLFW